MKPRAYVLLSGGIDSTVCLFKAHQDFDGNVEGISINYGQRHIKETEYAAKSCAYLGVKHRVVDLSGIVPKTMLTDETSTIPNKSYAEIEGVSPTYVPFRNGLLLSAVTSIVHGEYVKQEVDYRSQQDMIERIATIVPEWGIYIGVHAEDAQNWAYPDCTSEFTGAMANAIYIGTYRAIRLHTPLQWMNKREIITLGERLGVNWKGTWSCYAGNELHCGTCPTCRARQDGFHKAGVSDPTEYQEIAMFAPTDKDDEIPF